MRKLLPALLIAALLAGATAAFSSRTAGNQKSAAPTTQQWSSPDRPTMYDAFAAARWVQVQHDQTVWFFVAHQAELQRQLASRAVVRRSSPVGGVVGECSGFAIPDYIIQRESGGNPNAYNPSGAFGCAQTLLSHYSSGSCQGLDPGTIEGQRECVDILSNGGSNLAPWAATA